MLTDVHCFIKPSFVGFWEYRRQTKYHFCNCFVLKYNTLNSSAKNVTCKQVKKSQFSNKLSRVRRLNYTLSFGKSRCYKKVNFPTDRKCKTLKYTSQTPFFSGQIGFIPFSVDLAISVSFFFFYLRLSSTLLEPSI